MEDFLMFFQKPSGQILPSGPLGRPLLCQGPGTQRADTTLRDSYFKKKAFYSKDDAMNNMQKSMSQSQVAQ